MTQVEELMDKLKLRNITREGKFLQASLEVIASCMGFEVVEDALKTKVADLFIGEVAEPQRYFSIRFRWLKRSPVLSANKGDFEQGESEIGIATLNGTYPRAIDVIANLKSTGGFSMVHILGVFEFNSESDFREWTAQN